MTQLSEFAAVTGSDSAPALSMTGGRKRRGSRKGGKKSGKKSSRKTKRTTRKRCGGKKRKTHRRKH
jgi:hypothetical protein